MTDAMMRSGDTMDFSAWPKPTADKHSTGGIGDKVSLVLAPLAAAAGMAVPMMSGRGLGITGGTLDKLASIPGFDTNVSIPRMKKILADVGCVMMGQTDAWVPADKKLYALRDVTATVPSLGLITASIMSKKLAEGAQTLVFDVKCGRGAFMRGLASARALAESLTATGKRLGRDTVALITDMEQPLGRSVGNAVEVRESIEVLRGRGPSDTRELTLELTAWMAVLSGVCADLATARKRLAELLDNGAALEKFRDMVTAQGGDPRVCDAPDDILPRARFVEPVLAEKDGIVQFVDAEKIGRAALQLGAGRVQPSDTVDVAAGIENLPQASDRVFKGKPFMTLLASDETRLAAARELCRDAVVTAAVPGMAAWPRRLVLEVVTV
jgi:pyrimidine-nucleoside phosphorylase